MIQGAMTRVSWSVGFSVLGHGASLVLLVWLTNRLAPPPLPLPAAPQAASRPVPAPAPPAAPAGPVVTAGYRTMLSNWLESHKRYPESSRTRGEQGRAMLRFRVTRAGQVLNYAIVGSSGYPDLDAAV